ncbi:MAG: HipA family kinase [Chloroflexota bacterium]
MLRVEAIRYVTPLREGGSLPAVVDTAEAGPFAVKFRAAGQGVKALVAECIAAGIAEALGLPIPLPAIVALREGFGRAEPDPEIQHILRGSVGENFGLGFLSGALGFDPSVDRRLVTPDLAANIVWFDALLSNVDRTVRNTNILVHQGQIWLIDHGAALYFHHQWSGWEQRVHSPFPQIKDHVLLPLAGDLAAADERLRPSLTESVLAGAVADVDGEWLDEPEQFADATAHREAYVAYLTARLNGPRAWLQEAITARQRGPERLGLRATHRVV